MNTCDCPIPPGGSNHCESDQVAVCIHYSSGPLAYCDKFCFSKQKANDLVPLRSALRQSSASVGTPAFYAFIAGLINGNKGGTVGRKKVRGKKNKLMFKTNFVTPAEVKKQLSGEESSPIFSESGAQIKVTACFPGGPTIKAAVGNNRQFRVESVKQ